MNGAGRNEREGRDRVGRRHGRDGRDGWGGRDRTGRTLRTGRDGVGRGRDGRDGQSDRAGRTEWDETGTGTGQDGTGRDGPSARKRRGLLVQWVCGLPDVLQRAGEQRMSCRSSTRHMDWSIQYCNNAEATIKSLSYEGGGSSRYALYQNRRLFLRFTSISGKACEYKKHLYAFT